MGFRHGPKSLLNSKTLILYFLSPNPYTKQYDYDMLNELSKSDKQTLAVISDKFDSKAAAFADKYFYASRDEEMPDAFVTFYPLVISQIIAVLHSLKLGMTPDNPFPDGSVNRVVAGVTIY